MDTEDVVEEVNGFGDQCPDSPDASRDADQGAQFDRASSFNGPNRVAPYSCGEMTPIKTPCPEDEEQALNLIQELALGSEMFGPNGSHRPAGPSEG